ncbi:MAG: hypothetical protein WAU17_03780 [Nitrospirales bacterium]
MKLQSFLPGLGGFKAKTASRNLLLEIAPELIREPPTTRCFSMTLTRNPMFPA